MQTAPQTAAAHLAAITTAPERPTHLAEASNFASDTYVRKGEAGEKRVGPPRRLPPSLALQRRCLVNVVGRGGWGLWKRNRFRRSPRSRTRSTPHRTGRSHRRRNCRRVSRERSPRSRTRSTRHRTGLSFRSRLRPSMTERGQARGHAAEREHVSTDAER